jgi:type IV pilus assembly protein PilB
MQSADKDTKNISPERVADILVSEGEVTEEQVEKAWEKHAGDHNGGLGEILISLGYITAEELSRTLTRRLNVQYVVLSEEEIEASVRGLVEEGVLDYCGAVPLRMKEGKLVVAMKNPGDDEARSCVVQSAGLPIVPVAAAEDAIIAVRNQLLGNEGSHDEDEAPFAKSGSEDEVADRSSADKKRVPKLGSKRVGDILLSQGKLTEEELEQALELQDKNSKHLGAVLLELGYVEPADLAQALAQRFNMDYVVISELSPHEVDSEAIDSIDEAKLRKYRALPLRYEGDNLVIAMSDPNDLYALEDLRMIAGSQIKPVVVTEEDLQGALDHLFGAEDEESVDGETDDAEASAQDLDEMTTVSDKETPDETSEDRAEGSEITEASSVAAVRDPEDAGGKEPYSETEESISSAGESVAEASAAEDYAPEREDPEGVENRSSFEVNERHRGSPRTLSGKGKVGEILVAENKITEEQLRRAEALQEEDSRDLSEVLLSLGHVDKTDLMRATARRLNIEFIELRESDVDRSLLRMVDQRVLRKHGVMPLRLEDEKLHVAMSDPKDLYALEDIRMITGYSVVPVAAVSDDVRRVQNRLISIGEDVSEFLEEAASEGELESNGEVQLDTGAGEDEAPIIRLVSSILQQAVGEEASDIHIEPQAQEVKVRFRVDGVLREVMSVPKKLRDGVIARLKVVADLNIAERRVPQDGRFSVRISGNKIDLRVATIPTAFGEKVVLRLLDTASVAADLTKLGFSEAAFERYEKVFRRPYGAILVTGPTGSGKSTTLYATLNELNSPENNIITVEDPIEYRIPGLNQMQVNPKAGLTFASGLRSILRADPDIIMIGEIRDVETAKISVESSMTGHLVLATLHTNNAPGALTRLTEMGVEPFLISSAVDCVIAQRLARRLCEECKQPAELEREYLEEIEFPFDSISEEDVNFYKAVGCDRCGGTGYRGRLGLYELLVITESVRELVLSRASTNEIARVAEEEGMIHLKEDGLGKAAQGITSVEEILRTVV